MTVRLPVDQMDDEDDLPEGEAKTAHPRVLVVDDEPTIGVALSRQLREDIDVVMVTSGVKARELLEQDEAFDVIFCDMMMPELTGMELFTWIERHVPALAPCMVFMTGSFLSPKITEFLEETTNPVLYKPFDPGQVRALLKKFV